MTIAVRVVISFLTIKPRKAGSCKDTVMTKYKINAFRVGAVDITTASLIELHRDVHLPKMLSSIRFDQKGRPRTNDKKHY